MKTTGKTTTIESLYYNGHQSIEFMGLYKLNEFKFKIKIDHDSHASQSNSTIFVWSAEKLEWNVVATLHHTQMESMKVFEQTKAEQLTNIQRNFFQLDVLHLFELAKQIIF